MGKKDLSAHPVMAYKKEQKKKEIAKSKAQSKKKNENAKMLRDPMHFDADMMKYKSNTEEDHHQGYKTSLPVATDEPVNMPRPTSRFFPRNTLHGAQSTRDITPRPPQGPPPPSAFIKKPKISQPDAPNTSEKPPLPLEPPPFFLKQPPLPPGPPTPQAIARRDRGPTLRNVGPIKPTETIQFDKKQPNISQEQQQLGRLAPETTRKLAPDISFLPSALRVQRRSATQSSKKNISSDLPLFPHSSNTSSKKSQVIMGDEALPSSSSP
mmetsp:Transcript_6948/g.10350  ORF Transcript_6948/g.10350 Transcript_6948/m.10350 type:complete len:267 (+) Transcript_6948:80-880(+)